MRKIYTCPPPIFRHGEDLGKSPSGLHKARCWMGEVTDLQQLSIPRISLETIASTQKVLADEASPRPPPRSSPSHPNPRISETAYSVAGPFVYQRCPRAFRPGGSTEKLGEGKEKYMRKILINLRIVL